MTPLALVLTALWGGLVGVASGLLGIGGGVLVVPFLYALFAASWSGLSFPSGTTVAVAHATSLFVVIPTALSGLWVYHRARAIRWGAVVPMGLASMVTAVLAARLAVLIPADLLRGLFGALVLGVGVRMWPWRAETAEGFPPADAKIQLFPLLLVGSLVGALSALMGVGGGVVAIPLLIYLVKMDVSEVAATSIGLVSFAAPAGVLSYMVAGRGVEGLPAGTVGYVYLPAGLAMLPLAILLARTGAKLNRRMDRRRLRYLFGGVFMLLGGRLVLGALALLVSGG
jgi:uncharacterized protein